MFHGSAGDVGKGTEPKIISPNLHRAYSSFSYRGYYSGDGVHEVIIYKAGFPRLKWSMGILFLLWR